MFNSLCIVRGGTRRDHGAQYFTLKGYSLKTLLSLWKEDGLAGEWDVDPAIVEEGKIQGFESGLGR